MVSTIPGIIGLTLMLFTSSEKLQENIPVIKQYPTVLKNVFIISDFIGFIPQM